MSEELKACPFCERSTYLKVEEFTDTDYVPEKHIARVLCQNCFAKGPEKGSREAAIDAWNGRL